MVTACAERSIVCAVIQVEKAQKEGELIMTHDGAEGESCKRSTCI